MASESNTEINGGLNEHSTIHELLFSVINDLGLRDVEGFDYQSRVSEIVSVLHRQWIYDLETLYRIGDDISKINEVPLALQGAIRSKLKEIFGTKDSSPVTGSFISIRRTKVNNTDENSDQNTTLSENEKDQLSPDQQTDIRLRTTSSGTVAGSKNFYFNMLRNNKIWADKMVRIDPNFFSSRAASQTPHVLWIGCSDSRVHPSDLTGLQPGEVFVHRNVANLCIQTDLNMLSCLQYAVEVLEVSEVIVVGHYGCGGVKFAMDNKHAGIINQWIATIKDVYEKSCEDLEHIHDENEKFKRLVEINVEEQVRTLCKTSTIQKSWKKRISPEGDPLPRVHGWVYDLHDGIIRELKVKVDLPSFYVLEFADIH